MEMKQSIASFPTQPGVYLMKDDAGNILYVGKARNLRQRVRSYFGNTDGRPQIRFLMSKVTDISFMVTDTEKEALLLENILIKQHQPRYNLNLKDDKTYFSLRIDPTERFPRFTVVRKISRDGARYFGPYASAAAARDLLRQLQRMFPLRHYPLKVCMNRTRPCLYHQIGQCGAPCHNLITEQDYATLVSGAIMFMEGKSRDLISGFRQRMKLAAAAMQYEEAAKWRDLIKAIDTSLERQKIVKSSGDSDVLGIAVKDGHLAVVIMFIRGGSVSGSTTMFGKAAMDEADTISAIVRRHYFEDQFIPDELLLPTQPEDSTLLAGWLSEQKGKKVRILSPQKGDKLDLVRLAERNALAALQEKLARNEAADQTLAKLQEKLALPALPRRIECYDISNIQGRYAVGSGVTFTDGAADKAAYRRYRIKHIEGQDDFAMLKEVFSRRFSDQRINDWGLPDLVVVDGGKGQLNSTLAALDELGLGGRFPVVSLAKSRVQDRGKSSKVERSEERVFLPGRSNPLRLRQDGAVIRLLAAIRDEAHRFAITYHRNLRERSLLQTALQDLPGIGAGRARLLLQHFGSVEGVGKATLEELMAVNGIGAELAKSIKQHLGKV